MALLAGKILKASDLAAAIGSSIVVQAAPLANTDLNAAVMTNWGPSTNVVAPSWATKAQIVACITGAYPVTADGGYQFRVALGAATGIGVTHSATGFAASPRSDISWVDEITLLTTGTLALVMQGFRSSGAGSLRVDTASDFTYQIKWVA